MKLTTFQSGKGDCLLLESGDAKPKRVLIDGGMGDAYGKYAAPALAKIAKAGGQLDVVCLSHIDEDHITGILKLMDDTVAWRVHDFHVQTGQSVHKPQVGRPPDVKAVWHNGFGEQVKSGNNPAVLDMLSTTAMAALAIPNRDSLAEASHRMSVVNGEAQAIQLTRRLSFKQLNIPLNPEWNGKMVLVRSKPKPVAIGKMRIHILAPFKDDLVKLGIEWSKWLNENKKRLLELKAQGQKDEAKLHTSEFDSVSHALGRRALIFGGVMGDRKQVTAPNLASIMLYVVEGATSILLTGDGHADEVLKGLRHTGNLAAAGGLGLHVTVLKVPHHGSEYNTTEEFTRTITADHYVFCANGADENPDPRVVQAFLDSRLGGPGKVSPNPQAVQPFKMWFNSSATASPAGSDNSKHMAAIEQKVKKAAAKSSGQLTYKFLTDSSFTI